MIHTVNIQMMVDTEAIGAVLEATPEEIAAQDEYCQTSEWLQQVKESFDELLAETGIIFLFARGDSYPNPTGVSPFIKEDADALDD